MPGWIKPTVWWFLLRTSPPSRWRCASRHDGYRCKLYRWHHTNHYSRDPHLRTIATWP